MYDRVLIKAILRRIPEDPTALTPDERQAGYARFRKELETLSVSSAPELREPLAAMLARYPEAVGAIEQAVSQGRNPHELAADPPAPPGGAPEAPLPAAAGHSAPPVGEPAAAAPPGASGAPRAVGVMAAVGIALLVLQWIATLSASDVATADALAAASGLLPRASGEGAPLLRGVMEAASATMVWIWPLSMSWSTGGLLAAMAAAGMATASAAIALPPRRFLAAGASWVLATLWACIALAALMSVLAVAAGEAAAFRYDAVRLAASALLLNDWLLVAPVGSLIWPLAALAKFALVLAAVVTIRGSADFGAFSVVIALALALSAPFLTSTQDNLYGHLAAVLNGAGLGWVFLVLRNLAFEAPYHVLFAACGYAALWSAGRIPPLQGLAGLAFAFLAFTISYLGSVYGKYNVATIGDAAKVLVLMAVVVGLLRRFAAERRRHAARGAPLAAGLLAFYLLHAETFGTPLALLLAGWTGSTTFAIPAAAAATAAVSLIVAKAVSRLAPALAGRPA